MPGERLLHEELRLLTFLHRRPLTGLDCVPINLVELSNIRVVLSVGRCRIGGGEGPAPPVGIRPGDHLAQVCLQVNDRPLASSISELGVIRLMDDVKHLRPMAEVEGHAPSEARPGWLVRTFVCLIALTLAIPMVVTVLLCLAISASHKSALSYRHVRHREGCLA